LDIKHVSRILCDLFLTDSHFTVARQNFVLNVFWWKLIITVLYWLEVICNYAQETIFYSIFLNALLRVRKKPNKGQKILKANHDVLNFYKK
jgi:hypothetical protein